MLFVTIFIHGTPFKALVDSDASRTFIGSKGIQMIEKLNLSVRENSGKVQFANGDKETVLKEVVLPIQLHNKTQEINPRVLDRLPYSFVVGLDFLRHFKSVTDFNGQFWSFQSDPKTIYEFEYDNDTENVCFGIRELPKNRQKLLL